MLTRNLAEEKQRCPSAWSVLFLCRAVPRIICGELAFIEMLAAKSDIFVVCAKHDLGTFSDNAVLVVAGVADCLAAAPAHGLHFMNLVADREQSFTAREQLVLEICAQTIAHDRNVQVVYVCRYLPGGHRGG